MIYLLEPSKSGLLCRSFVFLFVFALVSLALPAPLRAQSEKPQRLPNVFQTQVPKTSFVIWGADKEFERDFLEFDFGGILETAKTGSDLSSVILHIFVQENWENGVDIGEDYAPLVSTLEFDELNIDTVSSIIDVLSVYSGEDEIIYRLAFFQKRKIRQLYPDKSQCLPAYVYSSSVFGDPDPVVALLGCRPSD